MLHKLVTQRRGSLERLKAGFEEALATLSAELPAALAALAPFELQILACGERQLLPAQVPAPPCARAAAQGWLWQGGSGRLSWLGTPS